MVRASVSAGVAQLLLGQLAAFLALLLVASAAHKWRRFERTRSVVHEFARVPAAATAWVVIVAAAGELSAGVLLLTPAHRRVGAGLAAPILCAYLALILRALAQGRRDIDCGCSFGAPRHSLGVFEVARNAALLLFALVIAVPVAGAALPLQPSQLLAACAFLVLYLALEQVAGLQTMRRGTVR